MESNRWVALDIFKAIAVFVMTAWHLSIWWVNLNPSSEKGLLMVGVTPWPYLLQVLVAFSGHFSMSIPVIAGASLRFYFRKIGFDKKKVSPIVKKACFLALLGFIMNFLAYGYDYWHLWNVLQLIGVAMIVISVFEMYLPKYFLALLGLTVILLSHFVRGLLQNLDYYAAFALIGDRFGDNVWPVFPWLGVVIYGFLFADLYLKFKGKKQVRYKLAIVFISFILILAALLKNRFFYAVDLQYPWGPLIFQPPVLTVLAQLSVFSISIVLLDFITTRPGRFGIVNVFSRGILWIYLIQMILGFRLIEFLAENGLQNAVTFVFVVGLILVLSYSIGVMAVLSKKVS